MEYHHRHMEQPGQLQSQSQWNYGWGPPAPAPAPPAPAQRNKRTHSESEDDAFSEESSKDAQSPGGDSCQLMTRKRRRGVIEKKRRDRINTSLTELKRLVPAACEKQGRLDTFAYDPQRYAMDYHNIGFRECAAEVARYLVSCEGLDIQDPLRLRLMSHLQCFAAQRELAAKSTNWGYPQYPTTPVPQPQHGYTDLGGPRQDHNPDSQRSQPTAVVHYCHVSRHPAYLAAVHPSYPPLPRVHPCAPRASLFLTGSLRLSHPHPYLSPSPSPPYSQIQFEGTPNHVGCCTTRRNHRCSSRLSLAY
ncbi:hypothetical protein SFRURICE_007236 [Spodoptera frugiperda]|nr:hypothetical protein SFRURICE_007236 [Spodoptera frugiperda]